MSDTKEQKDEEMEKVDESQEMEPDMSYTKELREATREVHKLSDILVNAKFALALSDDAVWYDGLLAFYELYIYFEEHLPEELLPKELHRTESFEKDFDFYFGPNWKETYEPRDSVKKYLAHLEEVRNKDIILLFAYAYQMYMALMSGGQLLQKKRMIARKLWIGKKDKSEEEQTKSENDASPSDLQSRPMPVQVTICPDGCAATYFSEDIKILKAKLRNVLNAHYGKFDPETKAAFIEESKNVFRYNGQVVRSIKGVNRANLRKLAVTCALILGVFLAIKFATK